MKRLQENICRVLLMNSNLQTNYNGGLERHRDGPFGHIFIGKICFYMQSAGRRSVENGCVHCKLFGGRAENSKE